MKRDIHSQFNRHLQLHLHDLSLIRHGDLERRQPLPLFLIPVPITLFPIFHFSPVDFLRIQISSLDRPPHPCTAIQAHLTHHSESSIIEALPNVSSQAIEERCEWDWVGEVGEECM